MARGRGIDRPKKEFGKKGKKPNPKRVQEFGEDDFDDEIDHFHKQRDVVPLNSTDDIGASDEDMETPVFDFEGIDDDDDDEEEDGVFEDDVEPSSLTAKILKTRKYLNRKLGGVDDEIDEDEKVVEKPKTSWGRSKRAYYNADNVDYEAQSSDEDSAAEEEAEVLRLQQERAKLFSKEDFGVDDVLIQDSHGSIANAKPLEIDNFQWESADASNVAISDLSKEEQSKHVLSVAPELVGLLSELNDAISNLDPRGIEVLFKVTISGMKYEELKHLLSLCYCQAIVCYLLLRSENHPVRGHPVLSRVLEMKILMDKLNKLSQAVSSDDHRRLTTLDGFEQPDNKPVIIENGLEHHRASPQAKRKAPESPGVATVKESHQGTVVVSLSVEKTHNVQQREKENFLGWESKEMLKLKASLEEKLKQKRACNVATEPSASASGKSLTRKRALATSVDFDDDAEENNTLPRQKEDNHPYKISELVDLAVKTVKKPKLDSGDTDLPMREDIGTRRKKYELSSHGELQLGPADDNNNESGSMPDYEDDFYQAVKQHHVAKNSKKADGKKLPPAEEEVDGKRHITYQMETNKGLTRRLKKLTKIPRKKYKLKHQKATKHRKGQVREIRKPTSTYGGEAAGINTKISHSIRFKS